MLQLSGMFLNRAVLSLQTGTPVATTLAPILNPNNLKVEGFYCQASNRKQAILVSQDIRDVMPQGLVVNDIGVLTEASELVRLQKFINLNYDLLGKKVFTTGGRKVGKVSDYAIDSESMFIKKLYASPTLFKGWNGGNVGIDRTQIVELTDKKIVINDTTQKVPAGAHAVA
jgi:sporulation protein YlmC with PRC-barrel domain